MVVLCETASDIFLGFQEHGAGWDNFGSSLIIRQVPNVFIFLGKPLFDKVSIAKTHSQQEPDRIRIHVYVLHFQPLSHLLSPPPPLPEQQEWSPTLPSPAPAAYSDPPSPSSSPSAFAFAIVLNPLFCFESIPEPPDSPRLCLHPPPPNSHEHGQGNDGAYDHRGGVGGVEDQPIRRGEEAALRVRPGCSAWNGLPVYVYNSTASARPSPSFLFSCAPSLLFASPILQRMDGRMDTSTIPHRQAPGRLHHDHLAPKATRRSPSSPLHGSIPSQLPPFLSLPSPPKQIHQRPPFSWG